MVVRERRRKTEEAEAVRRRPAPVAPPEPAPRGAGSVLRLQRLAGNAAVTGVIQRFTDTSGKPVLADAVIEELNLGALEDVAELIWEGRLVASPEERERIAKRFQALRRATQDRQAAPAAVEPEEPESGELDAGFKRIEDELTQLLASDTEEPAPEPEIEAAPAASSPEAAKAAPESEKSEAPGEAPAKPATAEAAEAPPKKKRERKKRGGGGGGASSIDSLFAGLGVSGSGVAKPPEATKPKAGTRLEPTMTHFQANDAIRGYSTGMKDETGASIVRTWTRLERYVSRWDRPRTQRSRDGLGTDWGFSCSYAIAAGARWVIHVHRNANGSVRAGNVQAADLEGTLGVSKESLSRNQLERIGIPTTEAPSDYVRRRWAHFGKQD
jgi:hypothetical protein